MKVGGLLLTGSAFAGAVSAKRRNFNAHLIADAHEDPNTNAQGQANFRLRNYGLAFELIVANIEDVRMAHIHLNEVLGPVSVWLHDFDTGVPSLVEGRVNGVLSEGVITDAEVSGPIDTRSTNSQPKSTPVTPG